MTDHHHSWLLDAVADETNGWAVGTFGAIAEFVRDPGEAAVTERTGSSASAATSRGGVRITLRDDLVPVAYETPNRDGETWSQAIALCLPKAASAMNRRIVLTELGPDTEAIRAEDRDAIVFDMGLGVPQSDICIRTHKPELIGILRSGLGRPIFEAGHPAMPAIIRFGPHRVFTCGFGRCEVFQPIPPPDGRSPEGPHTHVLPKVLRTGRTHSATTPIPDGLVPGAHLFPPSPVKDAMGRRIPYDGARHEAFAHLMERFGDRETLGLKAAVAAALAKATPPEDFGEPEGRHQRAALRVAIRQARMAGGSSEPIERWAAAFDRQKDATADETDEQPPH
ncbi:DUF6925 family protein [Enterovirga rhinocerotis]|uniref:Uncharacterized protein n=1 Tax=Enterovirga rhinocerotis TaxID=1339210 RepID=A0A4R7BV64_9HYPH|nr:hypothetical protein [Enterovirga rhinocerotis]TDR89293.1 hypothetical protein EV668_3783 [Enterovirga rhinocerotis]